MGKPHSTPSPASTNPFGRAPRRRPKRETRRRGDASPLLPPLPDARRSALTVLIVVFLSALLSLHFLPDRVSLRVGDISRQDIRAPRTVRYIDTKATQDLREFAAAHVDPFYTPAPYAAPEAEATIHDIYARLRRERLLANQNPVRAAEELRQDVGVTVPTPSLLAPLLSSEAGAYHLDQAERLSARAVRQAMEIDIRDDRPDDLARARARVTDVLAASQLPRADIPAVAALARAVVRSNRLLDARATDKAREAERRLVAPAMVTLFAGETVVHEGQRITPETIERLRALGLQNPRLDWGTVAEVTILVALMVGLAGVYLARFHRTIYRSNKMILLLGLLSALAVLGLKIGGTLLGSRLVGSQIGYIGMASIAASAMLVATLVHPRVALLIATLLSVEAGLVLSNDLRFTILILLSCVVSVYAVSDLRSRTDVVRAGVLIAAVNVLLTVVIGLMQGDAWRDLPQSMGWAASAGVVSVALFSFQAAAFERPFGITTHLGLLELSDPNRPLMQEFCARAPGTYTHSVMVGNLAVAAAEAIGADALLCRVGALYHDLGKMNRPEYFIENQHGENVHEKFNPSLSALVITAHVKDGLEIAERAKLPPVIRSFITEHHGTSLIRYFYHQHTGGVGDDAPGLEERFRYPGPKPQSRETAILMLADGVEAASRTLDKPTPGRISDLVEKIINGQLADGQLDECDLTLRDLRGIREAFTRLLSGMLHSRIEYPELLKTEKHGTAGQSTDPALPGAERRDAADPAPAGSAAA